MVRKIALFAGILLLFLLILPQGVSIPVDAQELTPSQRAKLEAEYAQLEKEIAEQQKILDATRAVKNTLTGDVTALNAQIAKAQAEINAKNNQIKQLGSQISTKSKVIVELSDRLAKNKESLASMLRQERELDEYSVVEFALAAEGISDFFADADAFFSLKRSMSELFSDIKSTRTQTEEERAALAKTQTKVADAKYEVETKKKEVDANKVQKQQLLTITTNQETEYQKVLAERQARAAAIRAALFPLRDAAAIKFEDALAFAEAAKKKTGVRPAFILAILTQESNLGANVGQCYLTNDTTGAGIGKNTGTAFAKVMKPDRDVAPFLSLSKRLGFDPHHQVVSCPQSIGYGGAMGPAQFIPSTWSAYESRIAAASGHAVPNPWSASDAITAMSLYLSDLGAGTGGYTAEHTAAAKYFAGGAWATSGQGYATSVLGHAERIQGNIDFLEDN